MLVFKKISPRTALFRSGAVQLKAAPPLRAEPAARVTYADVRLSSLGLAINRQGSFSARIKGGRG